MPFNHPPSVLTSTDWRCSSAQGAKKRKIWAIFISPQSAIRSSESGLLNALSLSLSLQQMSVLLAFPSSLLCYCMCVMPKNTLASTSKEKTLSFLQQHLLWQRAKNL